MSIGRATWRGLPLLSICPPIHHQNKKTNVVVRAFMVAGASDPPVPNAGCHAIPSNKEIARKISRDERRQVHGVTDSLGGRYVLRCQIGMRKGIPPCFIRPQTEKYNRNQNVCQRKRD